MRAEHAQEAANLVKRYAELKQLLAATYEPNLNHGMMVRVHHENGSSSQKTVLFGQDVAQAAFRGWQEVVRIQLAACRRRAAQIELKLED